MTKLADDRFWVVASDTAHRHVADLDAPPPRRDVDQRHAFVADVTVGIRAAQRAGPALARAAAVAHRRATCPTTRSRSAPHARSTSASRGCCACGSPTSASSATSCTSRPSRRLHVYDRLVAAGEAFGLRHAGLKALASLRMEKGVPRLRPRHRQHRLGAGGRARVRGRAGQAGRVHRPRRGAGPEGRGPAARAGWSRCWSRDPEPLLFHAEVVRRDGLPVGYVRAGVVRAHPRRRGRPGDGRGRQAAGPRPSSTAASGRSRSPGPRYPAVASLRPLYDPAMARIRA